MIGAAIAQRGTGELRLAVTGPDGLGLRATGLITSLSTQDSRTIQTDSAGRCTVPLIPFGRYVVELQSRGFAAWKGSVEVRSEVPVIYRATLLLTPIETTVNIVDSETLIDVQRTGSVSQIGSALIEQRRGSMPGRSVAELVNAQPGWLLEANGVLHPRGSEYDVQYVVDGLPVLDNRSPAFAQSLGADEFQSMRVLTGGYPAEYGRKLGGVIEVTTERAQMPGLHGRLSVQGSRYGTASGYGSAQYRAGGTTVGLSGESFTTDRYLDPPVVENDSNHGSGGGFSGRWDHDWSSSDRTRVYVTSRRTGFLVPNEQLQEQAGQRQDRTAAEASGQFAHQRVFSPNLIGVVQGRVRDTSAALWSNSLSTPIAPSQDRGFREWYGDVSVAGHYGIHEWKAGGDVLHERVREHFGYRIVAYRVLGLRVFDRDLPQAFAFSDSGVDNEQSAYVQDTLRTGRLAVSAGVRIDRYRFRVGEHAFSPRVGAAWNLPGAGLVLRASYDRVFQTPAIENLLLASADLIGALGGEGESLPLRPARAHFVESGFSKSLLNRVRIDGAWFHRRFENLADDSVLLNTGVSFPIAFQRGTVYGFEGKIEVPRWGRFSGFASWSNLVGRGELPIAGGLFLGDDAAELTGESGRFPITQDQRNSVRCRLRAEVSTRTWAAVAAAYNSGLPVEGEGLSVPDVLRNQYGPRVIERVNWDRGRLRPSYSLDAAGGAVVLKRERRNVSIQADLLNITDRLNVINFAGLFSGTAIEPGRSLTVRLTAEF